MTAFSVLALLAVAAIGGYAVSLAVRPWMNCRPCEGGGKDRGTVFKHAYRECEACGGTGRVPRGGVRLFQAARAQALKWGKPRAERWWQR